MCGPVCILCLATVYETRKWPAQTPITSYDWLCRVRAFARKSAIQAPSKYTNALLCVPTDEETFAWTLDNDIFLSGKDMAHPYWEYEMDHLGFTYMPPNEQDAEATKTFDFEGDMVDLTFIHEQCMTLLCDHLQQYALAHSIAGRCALETAWSCITGVSSNWALSRSEDEIPNPHLVCGKISEDEAWKFVDPFATATMLQDTTEAAIDAMSEIPYTLQDGASSASLFTPQETSYLVSKIWKARIAAEMPWVWKDLQSTFTNEKQDWAAIFHHLASLLEAPGPQFEDIMRDAPSLRNKLRICRAVKQLVSDMWAHELRMRLDLSSKPDWILNSFTLGAPPYPYSSTGASEVFFRTQEISQLSYVSVYLEKDGQISSLRFINEDGTYQVLGAHPEDIPAWEFQMNGGHITGAILSFQRLNGWNQKIRGIKLEINNGAVSPVMGIWDGDLIQFLRPGKDSFVTGFKYNIKLKFGISDILLMEFNPICTPKSKSCIESTFRNSSPLLRLCWPKEFPQESVQVQKCTGLEIQGVPVLPACFVLFDKFDPIHSIRVHISPDTALSSPLHFG